MRETLRFVAPRDRLLFLRSLPGFEGLATEDLMRIAQLMTEVYFGAGEVIYSAGDQLTAAYMLVEGRVRLSRQGTEVALIEGPSPIAFIGVLGGLEGIPGDIIADTDCLALKVTSEAITHVWEASPAVFENSLRLSASRTFEIRGRWPYNRASPPPAEEGVYPDEPSTIVSRIKALRSTGPLGESNVEAIIEIAKQQREVRVPAGTVIWSENDPAHFFLRIEYGLISIEQDGSEEVGLVGHDYSIGFFDSIGRTQRGYTATAKTEVVGVRTEADAMLSVFEDHFELGMRVLQGLSRQAVEHLWRTDELALMTR